MLSTILYIDLLLFSLIAFWVFVINTVGNTDQKGGVGFVAFFLTIAIVLVNILILLATVVINFIRS